MLDKVWFHLFFSSCSFKLWLLKNWMDDLGRSSALFLTGSCKLAPSFPHVFFSIISMNIGIFSKCISRGFFFQAFGISLISIRTQIIVNNDTVLSTVICIFFMPTPPPKRKKTATDDASFRQLILCRPIIPLQKSRA